MNESLISKEERNFAMFGHLSALSGFIIPLGNVLGPLIIWQLKKEDMPFAADQAKESLNFQITMLIAFLISAVLIVFLVGVILVPALLIASLVFTIIAALKANEGIAYRYPFALRFIK